MLTTMILVHPYTNMALLLTNAKENSDNRDNKSTKPIIKERLLYYRGSNAGEPSTVL